MNSFTDQTKITLPIICGAMYPCSNPQLIAAVSEAGGIGIIQPISLIYVHGFRDLREGIRAIRALTDKPIGFNAIVEQSSKIYIDRMKKWVDIALEEGVRFFVTALGKPDFVVEKAHAVGGVVYHDVTERKWALRALSSGVDGLICVNNLAGGHAGTLGPQELFDSLSDLGVPLVCAGGVGGPEALSKMLSIGYVGAQLGTRFIATHECSAHSDYKQAIVKAKAADIVLTDKISGVPVAVIETEYIRRTGTKANPIMRRFLRHPKLKHYARSYYTLKSVFQLKRANVKGSSYKDFFQAGKSVTEVQGVQSVAEIMASFQSAVERTTQDNLPDTNE